VMPHDLAGLRPDRQHRGGVEVVALAVHRVPRAGVAGAPVDEVERGVVRARDPGARAAGLVRIARLPGLVALLARSSGRVAAPQLFAGCRIPAVEEAPDAEFRA